MNFCSRRVSFVHPLSVLNRLFDEFRGIKRGTAKPLENSPLAAFKSVDAEKFLLKAAVKNQVLMLNDGHHQPQTRVLTTRLLRGLYAKGFRYPAMETLNVSSVETVNRKYPIVTDGYYTNESIFGDLARQALEIGYRLLIFRNE